MSKFYKIKILILIFKYVLYVNVNSFINKKLYSVLKRLMKKKRYFLWKFDYILIKMKSFFRELHHSFFKSQRKEKEIVDLYNDGTSFDY